MQSAVSTAFTVAADGRGYSVAMHARPPVLPLLSLLCTSLFCAAVSAAEVASVRIEGLDEAMTTNVRETISLQDVVGREVSEPRLEYLLRAAEDETRAALEPFGRYSPEIRIQDSRGAGDTVSVVIAVVPGPPVRVRESVVAIEGEGAEDRYLAEDLQAFRPQIGDEFDHALYEGSKARITRRLAERGYFDADFVSRRVEVTRAEAAADIDLRWDSGLRYAMGPLTFEQTPKPAIRDSLLEQLIYWEQGDYYHQGRLDRLRQSLVELDYFSRVDVESHPESAIDGEVPVTVKLTPAPRSIYSTGFSYGTDSGFGIGLGLERRYLNSRGHKGEARLDWSERRKTVGLQHRIPAFAWREGWYTTGLQFSDEQTDYIDTRRTELVFSRSGRYNRRLNLTASVHALRERWAYAYDSLTRFDAGTLYRETTLVYPSLRAEYIDVDDRFQPRRGFGGSATLRGGLASGEDSSGAFGQLHVQASWFKGLGARSRLIVRGEAGSTFAGEVVDIPPSLRFYAGGDRSVRGYAWREIGPRIPAAPGRTAYALGARNVLVGSAEFEQYFNDTWGMAVFADSGSAFDDTPDRFRTGVGVGLRWRSPVGPLRLDIARGLDDPDASFTLHLNLGADL